MAAGACASGTVTIAGLTASGYLLTINPLSAYPGDAFEWSGYAGSSTATVRVCNRSTSSATPTASTYNVQATSTTGISYQDVDTFAGTASTALTAHTSNSGHTWAAYNSVSEDLSTPLILNGTGGIYNTTGQPCHLLRRSVEFAYSSQRKLHGDSDLRNFERRRLRGLWEGANQRRDKLYRVLRRNRMRCLLQRRWEQHPDRHHFRNAHQRFDSHNGAGDERHVNHDDARRNNASRGWWTDSHVTAAGQAGIRLNGTGSMSNFSVQTVLGRGRDMQSGLSFGGSVSPAGSRNRMRRSNLSRGRLTVR